MKKSFMTRVLAVTLSAAMAFSLSSATNLVTASAATTSLTLSATDKTVDVDTRMVFKLAGSQASKWKVVNAATKDDAVAHLDRFTKKAVAVEAKSAGSTRLHVRVEKAKGKNAGKQKVLHADITVNATDATLASVTQKKADTLEAVLTAEVDSVAAANFSVVRDDGNVVIPVKAASLGTDKKTVTITTFSGMTDAKEYTVTYTNPKVTDAEKAKSEQKFVATSSNISDLALDASTITAASSTEVVKVQTIGDNGVILNEYKFSELAAQNITVSVTNISSGGYSIDDRIYLANVGDTATVNVVYHTYKYVNNVEEGKIEKSFTVTAVADATTMSSWGYTIRSTGSVPSWNSSSYTQNTKLAVGDSREAYFYFKDNKGVDKTSSGYTVSSSDTSVMIINGTIIDNQTGIAISGVKAGNAYIVVSDSKGNLVTTLAVTVLGSRAATSVQLGSTSVTISNAISTTSSAGIDKKSVTVAVKDQYGETIGTTTGLTETLVSPSNAVGKPKIDFTTNGKVAVTAGNYTAAGTVKPIPAGRYVFKVSYSTSVYSTLVVNVVEPNKSLSPTYDVRLSLGDGEFIDANSSIDLKTTTNTTKALTVQMGVLYGGVLGEVLDCNSTGDSVAIKSASGNAMSTSLTISTGAAVTTSNAIYKKYGTGSYTATVKKVNPTGTTGTVERTIAFTIADSQVKATATVKNTAIANTLKAAFVSSAGNVVYSYDGKTLNITDKDICFVNPESGAMSSGDPAYRTTTSNSTYYVYYVWVKVPINSTTTVWQKVSVNATFTGVTGE